MSAPHRDKLLGALAQSFVDQNAGIAPASNQKQSGCFDRWRIFLDSIGIKYEWLEEYSPDQQCHFISAFAGACRRNEYGKTQKTILQGSTIKSTVTNVRSAFRTNLRPDPALDKDSRMSLFLTQELSGYTDADPSSKQEKALPLSVF